MMATMFGCSRLARIAISSSKRPRGVFAVCRFESLQDHGPLVFCEATQVQDALAAGADLLKELRIQRGLLIASPTAVARHVALHPGCSV